MARWWLTGGWLVARWWLDLPFFQHVTLSAFFDDRENLKTVRDRLKIASCVDLRHLKFTKIQCSESG